MLLHILLRDEEEFEGGGDVGGADRLALSYQTIRLVMNINKWIVGGG